MAEETMNIKALYEQLEADSKSRSNRGEKAEKIRGQIRDIGKATKRDRLDMSVLYKMCKQMVGPENKLDRPYFTSIVTKAWETEKDDEGRTWVLVNKEKRPVPKPPE